MCLGLSRDERPALNAFQTLLKPFALLGINNMGKFCAYVSAVSILQGRINLTQSGYGLPYKSMPADIKSRIEVCIGKSVMLHRQIVRNWTTP